MSKSCDDCSEVYQLQCHDRSRYISLEQPKYPDKQEPPLPDPNKPERFMFRLVNGSPIEVVNALKSRHKFTNTCPYGQLSGLSESLVNSIIVESCKFLESAGFGVVLDPAIDQEFVWPRIKDFDLFLGLAAIDTYIAEKWEVPFGWRYCLDFVSVKKDLMSTYYGYQVVWSMPTELFPVPSCSTSVYFTIEVSHILPMTSPVKASFVVEGMRQVFDADDVVFRSSWIRRNMFHKNVFLACIQKSERDIKMKTHPTHSDVMGSLLLKHYKKYNERLNEDGSFLTPLAKSIEERQNISDF